MVSLPTDVDIEQRVAFVWQSVYLCVNDIQRKKELNWHYELLLNMLVPEGALFGLTNVHLSRLILHYAMGLSFLEMYYALRQATTKKWVSRVLKILEPGAAAAIVSLNPTFIWRLRCLGDGRVTEQAL
eukprot:4154676-Amphidinium_carterae.1